MDKLEMCGFCGGIGNLLHFYGCRQFIEHAQTVDACDLKLERLEKYRNEAELISTAMKIL
jgi:hypothetical protein